jgi:hypothetical protein
MTPCQVNACVVIFDLFNKTPNFIMEVGYKRESSRTES